MSKKMNKKDISKIKVKATAPIVEPKKKPKKYLTNKNPWHIYTEYDILTLN